METSGSVCSVCLSKNGELIKENIELTPNRHASILTVLIQQLMAETGHSLQQLDAIAFSNGPGSYTGLRIGASCAKGLCFTLDKPLIGISTLQALAWKAQFGITKTKYLLMPVIQAKKDVIYTAIYDYNMVLLKAEDSCALIDVSKTYAEYRDKVFISYFNLNSDSLTELGCFGTVIGKTECFSSNIVELSFLKYKSSIFEDLKSFEPFYITGFGNNFKKG